MTDTPNAATALPDTHLSAELRAFVESLDGQDSTVGALVDQIGDRGFGLLLLILALPAALPIPAPGYATPFGVLMIALGAQMIKGRTTPWFPEKVRGRVIPFKLLDFSVKNARFPLRVVELLIRPRLQRLTHNRAFLAGIGAIIALMAVSMSIPLPLTNTAPSFVIFVLAAGMLEEDGLVLLAGLILAPVAASISGLALYVAITVGAGAVEETVKPMIKGWLGMG